MHATRRAVLAALAMPALPRFSHAAAWPDRPVRIIVPFAPGGGNDVLARMLAEPLSTSLGQPFIVENRPGAGGTVGTALVANSPPDGQMILMGHIGTLAVNATLYPTLGYDPLNGFAPVSLIAVQPNLLVVNPTKLPVQSVAELVRLAKEKPGTFAYGSGGNGSVSHIAMEAFARASDTQFIHVPYRGTGPMMTDLLSGNVQLTMTGMVSLLPDVRAGQLRALGVSSSRRLEQVPDIPAIAETLPGFEALQWLGIVAPAGTPRPIVLRLNGAIADALRLPAIQQRLLADGAVTASGTPEEFGTFIRAEIERWAPLIRAAGLRPE